MDLLGTDQLNLQLSIRQQPSKRQTQEPRVSGVPAFQMQGTLQKWPVHGTSHFCAAPKPPPDRRSTQEERSNAPMKKLTQKHICCIPLAVWIVVIPLVVRMKAFANPFLEYPWYSRETAIADFFLFYKSMLVTAMGALMLLLLLWQVSKVKRKETLLHPDTRIFLPILAYLTLAVLSSLFSEHSYFCTHGVPDQFETVWNLIAYVTAAVYCYYVVVYLDCEMPVVRLIYAGAACVGLICVLQFFKIDIYRLIYQGDNITFAFRPGLVYGSFYNINYVGFYTLLFLPLFVLFLLFYKDFRVRAASALLLAAFLISIIGAESSAGIVALAAVAVFAALFFLFRAAGTKKRRLLLAAAAAAAIVCALAAVMPRVSAYIKASDTEKKDIDHIFTRDDHVEIGYRGNVLNISMPVVDASIEFHVSDQTGQEVGATYAYSEQFGDQCFLLTDERFSGIAIRPALLSEETGAYGFTVWIDDKGWTFTDQMTEDGTYYHYSGIGSLTKLTEENVSADFGPLVDKSSLGNGRGFLWNKTIAVLKNFILFGSGADTFVFEFPNGDFVDRYNNGYDNMFVTRPHNLYLQIAVQTGVLSLICFLVFYLWYFVSSLRLYFRQRFDNPLVLTGFAAMLGTAGYMISGLANDSTITVSPLYWAMMGVGIGINHKLRHQS